MSVLLIEEKEIPQLINLREAIDSVEEAFEARGSGKSQMPSKSYIYFEQFNGDFRVMPAYLEESNVAGVKVVNSHPDNPRKNNLPSVMAIIVLLDPETGKPICVLGGTEITNLRTGAAGAVAAKYLARKDSKVVGMIGTGAQAKTQLLGLNEIFSLEKVRAFSKFKESQEKYVETMKNSLPIDVEGVEKAKEAVKDADIVVTTTPSKKPLLKKDWISAGAHINAIGADAKNKQELEPEILKRAKVIVDEWEQASHSGEISASVAEGKFSKRDLHAEIGQIVTGQKPGRISGKEITVFDSTGLAVQDVATASKVYEKALEKDVGQETDLLGLDQ